MGKHAILFDLDNTLYDYNKSQDMAIKCVFEEFKKRIKVSRNEFLQLYNTAKEEIHRELSGTASSHNKILYFQRMVEKTHNTIEPSFILKLNHVYWKTFLRSMNKITVPFDVLDKIKDKKIKIAIVSDLTTEAQLKKIKKLGLSKYVDVLVTSEEAGSEKPHAIMFLLALNKLGVIPKDAIMVGDNTIADVEGANFVGLDTVLIKNGAMSKEYSQSYRQPNYTIKKISDILTILDEIELRDLQEEGYTKYNCNYKKTKSPATKEIVELNHYRNILYDLKLIGAYDTKVGYGNISVRTKNKMQFIISGTTTGNYKQLNEKHYSKVTQFDINKNNLTCKGAIKASSESLTHGALYLADSKIHAVIHIHNLKMWAKLKHKIPTTSDSAKYGTPALANEIMHLYKNNSEFRKNKIAVLGGHKEGLISFGKNLKEAYNSLIKYYNKIY